MPPGIAGPADFFSATWDAVWGAYVALFEGAVFDPNAATFARGIKPITESVVADQQQVADTFFSLGLIPRQIKISDVARRSGS